MALTFVFTSLAAMNTCANLAKMEYAATADQQMKTELKPKSTDEGIVSNGLCSIRFFTELTEKEARDLDPRYAVN